ncbi:MULTISPECIES: MarR family winged helix-turn-helix transcriptional regulator [unclassified Pseudofrankia]|uniref:MarR family winged helix-turn-helix transcriptional regulator n=1 Tax=unclassified Pseudofrankia TaxID=2994372 RepID=UPI000ADE66E6|nr:MULTISPECIES: MarR family transcriptional regulator [unclassified Pseudofrankia]MDT3445588.1 MarR family transcriptional regulator [Pseudofrankia sp. BMG5.37]
MVYRLTILRSLMAATPSPRERWAAARPDLDTSPMEVIALLKHVQALRDLALEPLYDGAPVTAPEVDVLIHLRHAEQPVIARRLAERMRCSRAAISKTLAKLEGRGYVERQPSPTDRRAALVTISPAGAAVVDSIFPRQLAIEAELLAGLGPDRARVVEALTLLVDTVATRVAADATAP